MLVISCFMLSRRPPGSLASQSSVLQIQLFQALKSHIPGFLPAQLRDPVSPCGLSNRKVTILYDSGSCKSPGQWLFDSPQGTPQGQAPPALSCRLRKGYAPLYQSPKHEVGRGSMQLTLWREIMWGHRRFALG